MKRKRRILFFTLVCFYTLTGSLTAQNQSVTRDFFGVDFWTYDPALWQEFFNLLDEDSVQFGLLGFGVGWEMIEPNPPVHGVHQYNWARLDELMQLGVASGRVFDMNILIRSDWATVVPASEMDEICCDMSPPREDADSDTTQWGMTAYQAYGDFIFNLVERYDADGVDDAPGISRAAIRYLQLGDEPDAPGHFVENGGTPENYDRMLATMYRAAKSADPNILVVRGKSNPGGIFDDDPDETALQTRRRDYLDFIATSLRLGQDHFDLFAINYSDHYTGLFPFTRWLQAEMAKNGYSKPIMVGDARTTAWPRNNDGGIRLLPRRYAEGFAESLTDDSRPRHAANRRLYHADEVRQSLRKLILALASGQQAISLQPAWGPVVHERMFWQDAGLLDSWIMEATNSIHKARKPVYYAAKQLIDALLGADRPVRILDLGADVYACQVSRQGENFFLLWHENQFEVDEQEVLRRRQNVIVDLTPFVATAKVRVQHFVIELDSNRAPIYPDDVVVSATELAIDETPVLVEAIAATSVTDGDNKIPQESILEQNYPNPFNPQTTIEYQIPISSHVMLRILNAMGQEVQVLVNENQPAGGYSATWDGKDGFGKEVAGGIYFLQMRAKDFVQAKKLLLLK